MLSVWKLIGGVGVILSICCIPAWITTNHNLLWSCFILPEWRIFRSRVQEDRPLQLSWQPVALLRQGRKLRLALQLVPEFTDIHI